MLSGSALPDPKFGHRLDIMLLMSWVRWDGGVRGDCKYEWYEAIDAPRAVRPALASAPGERALLVDRHGRRLPYHTLRRVVLRAAEAAGFGTAEARITAHVFRRSCTSELIKANANVYHVSRFLGHESLDTLQHYVRLNVTDLCKTHHETHPREKDEEIERGSEHEPEETTDVRG